MMTFEKVEQAGMNYFSNNPTSDYAAAERVARKTYAVAIEREWFVAGWNQAFWNEQGRVLKASRAKAEG